MRYLYPGGGELPPGVFGYIIQPRRWMKPNNNVWAADNDQYSGETSIDDYMEWLMTNKGMVNTCLFATAPDVVGNVLATLDLYRCYAWRIKEMGYPVALVGQDGLESMRWPPEYDALFIGGSTEWKLSDAAVWCIKRAQMEGKHIHIGRVNSLKRYKHFRLLRGSASFTCDGTSIRYGEMNALRKWRKHESQKPLFYLSVLGGNYSG